MSPKVVLVEDDIKVALEQRAIKTLHQAIETAPSPQDKEVLPDDVLIHIFLLVLQDHGPVVLPIRKHETPPQLVLSHVCSRWRVLVLGTFELWNNICLVNRDDNCVSLLRHEWFSRVGSSPIELSLLSDGPFWDDHATIRDDDVAAARIIQDTVSNLKLQIKMLHIYLTFGQLKALSSFPNTILPRIEKLELKFGSYDVEEIFDSTPISFPRLRSVVISDKQSKSLDLDVLLNISLPWSQLRCLMLHFKARYLIRVFDTLRRMPLLQELHLCIRSDPSHHLGPLEELIIPSLRRICLKLFIHPYDINKILRSITCPALVEFDINRNVWSKEIIKQQYNLQGLEELSFLNHTTPASSILQDAPKLRRLSIRGDIIDDEAIAGLSNGTLGRYLKSLTVTSTCDRNRLLSMVEMRKRTVDRLIENGCNWREMITVLTEVDIDGKDCNNRKCGKERVEALKKVGITVWIPEPYMES